MQQRVIGIFLTLHVGSMIVESEKKSVASTEGCANHVRHDFEADDGKAMTVWNRYLPTLLQFCMKKLDDSTLKEVQHVETCLGGDHRKGCCTSMAIVLIRHANEFKEPHRIELKLG